MLWYSSLWTHQGLCWPWCKCYSFVVGERSVTDSHGGLQTRNQSIFALQAVITCIVWIVMCVHLSGYGLRQLSYFSPRHLSPYRLHRLEVSDQSDYQEKARGFTLWWRLLRWGIKRYSALSGCGKPNSAAVITRLALSVVVWFTESDTWRQACEGLHYFLVVLCSSLQTGPLLSDLVEFMWRCLLLNTRVIFPEINPVLTKLKVEKWYIHTRVRNFWNTHPPSTASSLGRINLSIEPYKPQHPSTGHAIAFGLGSGGRRQAPRLQPPYTCTRFYIPGTRYLGIVVVHSSEVGAFQSLAHPGEHIIPRKKNIASFYPSTSSTPNVPYDSYSSC